MDTNELKALYEANTESWIAIWRFTDERFTDEYTTSWTNMKDDYSDGRFIVNSFAEYKLIHIRHKDILEAYLAGNSVEIEYEFNEETHHNAGWYTEYNFVENYGPDLEYRLKEEEDVETLFEQSSQSISSELSDSSNTSDIGLPNINNFKDFGFTGDFEGEILKEVDEYYIGYIKWDDNIYTCCWTEPGNCEMTLMEKGSSFDTCSAWQSEYNLTPIKKEWYENPDNFPCLITIESGGMVLVHYQVDGISYDYRDNSYNLINGSWKLATKAELMSLYYKEE